MSDIKRVNFVNIPQELKSNTSFCLWKYEKRSGRPTKVPYNPKNGQPAKTNDATTFADFSAAMTAYAMGGWDGIGYRVSEGIGAIDIDHCIREDGSLNDVAASILSFFPDAYFEKSPSGSGLRGFFKLSPDFVYDKTVYYINNRNDTLNARFLHENSFDFKPNFKIFINTNYKPSVSDMTLFYSNRLKLIPFKRHFEEHEQDKGLKTFFASPENQSAIFNWCYEGYKRLKSESLTDPDAVISANKEYEEESDRIGQFVDAWLEEGEAYEVRTSAAYRLYGEWCDKYGYRKENSTNFNMR